MCMIYEKKRDLLVSTTNNHFYLCEMLPHVISGYCLMIVWSVVILNMIVSSIGVLVSVFRQCQKKILSRRKRLILNQLELYQELKLSHIQRFYALNRLMSECYRIQASKSKLLGAHHSKSHLMSIGSPHGFRLLNSVWGDHFKWIKKTHLTLWSFPPFIVTIMALVKYSRSLISRPNLFYNGKYLVATTFETSVQLIFKDLGWIFKLSYNTYYIFSGLIKNRMFKNWIHFSFNFFPLYPKINMDEMIIFKWINRLTQRCHHILKSSNAMGKGTRSRQMFAMASPFNRYIYLSTVFFFHNTHCFFYCY